jgi:hypothetical protein
MKTTIEKFSTGLIAAGVVVTLILVFAMRGG